MATYTPEQFDDLLTRFANGLPVAVNRATLVAAQQLKGDIPGRIHRRGGTKDVDGGTRGYRSEKWVTEREDEGLPIGRVDHTFNGDLKRSYKLLVSKKQIDLRIFGNDNVKKARGNERWFIQENGAPVWEASKAEEKKARKAFNTEITNYIKQFFSG